MKNLAILIVFLLLVSAFIVARGRSTSQTDLYDAGLSDNTLNQDSSLEQGSSEQTATQEALPMKSFQDFEPIEAKQATIKTSKGDIVVELYPDKVPLTVTNFLTLAKSGYYNGIKFHRIIADFMAQVGDPLTKDESKKSLWGTGGPGYTIPDEFDPSLKHDSEGILSMANAGANTGGSQFFITFEATPWLDGKHAVFGKVTSGMDVLRSLQIGDQIVSITF